MEKRSTFVGLDVHKESIGGGGRRGPGDLVKSAMYGDDRGRARGARQGRARVARTRSDAALRV